MSTIRVLVWNKKLCRYADKVMESPIVTEDMMDVLIEYWMRAGLVVL